MDQIVAAKQAEEDAVAAAELTKSDEEKAADLLAKLAELDARLAEYQK